MSRFLVAAPTRPGRSKNGWCLGLALRRLGHEVRFFDYDLPSWRLLAVPKPLRRKAWHASVREDLNSRLLKLAADWRPDAFVCVKGLQIARETIVEIGRLGIGTAGYWIDDPLDHERSLINASAYHLYLTNDEGSIARYRAAGVSNVRYFPSAVDEMQFHPLASHAAHPAVSFVGTLSEYRKAILAQVLDHDIRIYGPGWLKNSGLPPGKLGREAFGPKVNRIFNDSRINLNIHNWFGTGTAMNLRLFEVPAAGGFLLTDWVGEIDAHFRADLHLVCWRSVDELRDKLAWYLAHDAERQRIARAGYEHTLRHHTYAQRARALLQHLELAPAAT